LDIPYIVREKRLLSGIGVEYGIKTFVFDIGYKFGVEGSLLQIGIGATIKNFDISYGFVPSQWLNNSHRINITYRF
jgi:hypothetical protein